MIRVFHCNNYCKSSAATAMVTPPCFPMCQPAP